MTRDQKPNLRNVAPEMAIHRLSGDVNYVGGSAMQAEYAHRKGGPVSIYNPVVRRLQTLKKKKKSYKDQVQGHSKIKRLQ